MTPNDLEIIKRRASDLFPALSAWVASLNSTQTQAHARKWEACLLRFERDDVNDTLDYLSSQPDSPWPWPSDMERSGAIIARETGDRIGRIKEAASSPADSLPERPTAYRGSGVMSRVMEAIRSDQRHSAECLAFRTEFGRCLKNCPVPRLVGSELAKEDVGLAEDAQRYGCALCRDTGFISCLKAADVAETIRSGAVPRIRSCYSVLCSCRLGDQLANQGSKEGKRPPERYRPTEDVRALASDAEIVATCRSLAETWGGRRNAGFDQFNRQTEFV